MKYDKTMIKLENKLDHPLILQHLLMIKWLRREATAIYSISITNLSLKNNKTLENTNKIINKNNQKRVNKKYHHLMIGIMVNKSNKIIIKNNINQSNNNSLLTKTFK